LHNSTFTASFLFQILLIEFRTIFTGYYGCIARVIFEVLKINNKKLCSIYIWKGGISSRNDIIRTWSWKKLLLYPHLRYFR